jgi:hypothetical protein
MNRGQLGVGILLRVQALSPANPLNEVEKGVDCCLNFGGGFESNV